MRKGLELWFRNSQLLPHWPHPHPLTRALSTAGKQGNQAESGSSGIRGTKEGTVVAPEKGELRGSHPSEHSARPGSLALALWLRGTRAFLALPHLEWL